MAGLVAVTSVTATMGAFGIMVEDKSKKIYKDFYVSPVKRHNLAGGYLLSALFISVVMSIITVVLTELYVLSNGGDWMPLGTALKVLGLILLSALSSSSFVFFIVSFFRSTNAYGVASTILGTLIGFLTGIYIPIGNLPAAVQTVIKFFPVSHSAALLRQVMMEAPMSATFAGAPAQFATEFKEMMGVTFTYGNSTAGAGLHITVLALTTVVFFALTVVNLSRKEK